MLHREIYPKSLSQLNTTQVDCLPPPQQLLPNGSLCSGTLCERCKWASCRLCHLSVFSQLRERSAVRAEALLSSHPDCPPLRPCHHLPFLTPVWSPSRRTDSIFCRSKAEMTCLQAFSSRLPAEPLCLRMPSASVMAALLSPENESSPSQVLNLTSGP